MNPMTLVKKLITILLADDDEDDCLLLKDAFLENGAHIDFRCVHGGEELMDYLLGRGRFGQLMDAPRPGLILLDFHLPGKNGNEVLREIKTYPELRVIPIIFLSGTSSEAEIRRSYDLGINSFIVKPSRYDDMVEVAESILKYWTETVTLPAAA